MSTVGLLALSLSLTHTHHTLYTQVADSAFHFTLTTQQGIAIILPLIIVCCWIRELEGLTMFSLIANICIVFSLAVIFYELLYQLFSDDGEEMAAIRRDPDSLSPLTFKTFPLYFGSAVYAFEGIGVVSSTA